jgi:hypothetical protein
MLNDLDLNRHLNNGSAFTLADLGRIDWFWHTGCLKWCCGMARCGSSAMPRGGSSNS